MFPEGGCWADGLSNVEKTGEQAGFRNLAFLLWVLGKLSGIQPGHDVVQMCLSSGGRENLSWPCSQNAIFFSCSGGQPPAQGARKEGLYGFKMEQRWWGLGRCAQPAITQVCFKTP